MKEKRYWLTEEQIGFIQKLILKIERGWDLYSINTISGLEEILEWGFYRERQRDWLINMRWDYITDTKLSTIL